MIVYNTGEKAAAQAEFIQSICPAAHLAGKEVPSEWVDDNNKPVEINVTFKFGRAEVPENIGEYLIKYQLASKTKLILPRRHLVEA